MKKFFILILISFTSYQLGFAQNQILGNVGGMDVTNIADGAAKFIVTRTKQELDIAFFSHLKKALNDSSTRDFRTFFPATAKTLNVIGAEIYNYKPFLATLVEAFDDDLKLLPQHLPNIIQNHPDLFRAYPEIGLSIKSGCYIADNLMHNMHPIEIVNGFPNSIIDSVNRLNHNVASGIKMMKQAAKLMDVKIGDSTVAELIEAGTINSKLKNGSTLDMLLQTFKSFTNGITLERKSPNTGSVSSIDIGVLIGDGIKCKEYIQYSIRQIKEINDLIHEFKKAKGDSEKVELFAVYATKVNHLIGYVTDIRNITSDVVKSSKLVVYVTDINVAIKEYSIVSDNLLKVMTDIVRKNYEGAVLYACNIYQELFVNKSKLLADNFSTSLEEKGLRGRKVSKSLAAFVDTFSQKPNDFVLAQKPNEVDLVSSSDSMVEAKLALTPEIETELKKVFKEKVDLNNSITDLELVADALKLVDSDKIETFAEESKSFINVMLRYGTFMAAMTKAKTSDDVEQIIETFAMPPGSSRVKREARVNISLNAYCGTYVGFEQIQGYKNDNKFTMNAYGVTAPIGIAFSIGNRQGIDAIFRKSRSDYHWSYSAFLSIIDLGTIAAFRFKDSTSSMPKIELKNIISPGLFLSVGLPQMPISLNAGVQLGPQLRSVTSSNAVIENSSYLRYSFSAVVDLPVINLYTRSSRLNKF